jgi:hypothetical protein
MVRYPLPRPGRLVSLFRLGERLSEEACAGKPQAGFCEGEAHNDARLNLVALSIPKGESNGEDKVSLNIGGALPTRLTKPRTRS